MDDDLDMKKIDAELAKKYGGGQPPGKYHGEDDVPVRKTANAKLAAASSSSSSSSSSDSEDYAFKGK